MTEGLVPEDQIPAVQFRQVSKAFGSQTVLSDLNLNVPAGQRVSVIGASGSGKTTLLRVLAGLERPDKGEVLLFGQPLWTTEEGNRRRSVNERHLRAVGRSVGMVFQHFHLFPHMTAVQNVMEGPVRVLSRPKKQARESAMEWLSLVGMKEHAEKWPAQLSGGQQQRVAIARALAMRPKVVLFDEVTSALDPELVGEVLDVIHTIAEQFELTMLIVTHEMSFAEQVSHRVLMLDGGSIIEDSDPSLLRRPSHPRTQRFLSAVRRA